MTDWLDSEDGRAAVEAGAKTLNSRHADIDANNVLAAVLALTKPCPTCGGSGGWDCSAHDATHECESCRGSGTVPLLVPREEG